MSRRAVTKQESLVVRAVRLPSGLRDKIAAEADAPAPAEILALAADSLADIPESELRLLIRKLGEPEP